MTLIQNSNKVVHEIATDMIELHSVITDMCSDRVTSDPRMHHAYELANKILIAMEQQMLDYGAIAL